MGTEETVTFRNSLPESGRSNSGSRKPTLVSEYCVPNADVQRCIVYRGHAAESDVQLLKILAQQITLSMQRHILKVISSCAPCGCRNNDP